MISVLKKFVMVILVMVGTTACWFTTMSVGSEFDSGVIEGLSGPIGEAPTAMTMLEDSPESAVKGFFETIFTGDAERAAQYVCRDQLDALNSGNFAMPEGTVVDVSDLTYETLSVEGDLAMVHLSGLIHITLSVEGTEVSQDLDAQTLGFSEIPVVREDGLWKVCEPELLGE